jgi:anaerobic magnesium-protoporphyrin IX monomethyl ester cyclase
MDHQEKPVLKKKESYFKPAASVDIQDAFIQFSNPDINFLKSSYITLIRPPIIFSAKSYSTPITLPVGISYIAAALKKSNYRVKIIDCVGAGINEIHTTVDNRFKIQGIDVDRSIQMINKDCDIIGISTMFSQEWPHIRRYINKVRDSFPNAKIIVGGEHATAMPEFSLRDCPAIDYIIKGEGELALIQLVYNIRKGIEDKISGVVFLKDGRYNESLLAPRLVKIENLPWPSWELLDIEPYFQPNFTMGISQGRNMPLLATRGCPYQCTFCSSPQMWTTRYVMRPASDVVDEIEYYIKKYQINSVDFYDLTAIVKKEWVMDFTNELKRRNLDITWQLPSGTRSEALDEEVISRLADTGIKFLVYAPESGSKRILKEIKKKVNLKKLTQSVSFAKKNKIITKLNFIIGFPNENRLDMLKTLLFIWKLALLKVNDCNLSIFSPYPGSEIYDELRKSSVIPEINDAYFESLITQFDFTASKSYCRDIGTIELSSYRIIGMSIFYGLSYFRCPGRLLRLIKLSRIFISKTQDFEPDSMFEQRIFDYIARKSLSANHIS